MDFQIRRLLSCRLWALLSLPAWSLLCSFAPRQEPLSSLPWRTVPVQAIQVADDDGGRQSPITPQQFQTWIDFTNKVFASAHIRFSYRGDDQDSASIRSTLLNSMMEKSEKTFAQAVRAGNKIAARYPGKLTVFIRWGNGDRPSGNGFSWCDYNFVAMSPFSAMSHCGHAHVDALAHEIGHYFGLPHTFIGEPFPTQEAAEDYFRKKGSDPAVFDGDGFSDTPPDPGIRTLECAQAGQVELNGVVFNLPRRNIMSYYDERDSLSAQQVERVRWILDKRLEGGMAMPSNEGAQVPIEAEALPVVETKDASTSVQAMDGFGFYRWSGGKQLFCSGKPDSSVTLQFDVPRGGVYTLNLYLTLAPDFGKVQCQVDDQHVGAPIDLYAPVVMPSGRIHAGKLVLAKGTHKIVFTVTGKNARSTNYRWGIDCLELLPQESATARDDSRSITPQQFLRGSQRQNAH